MKFDTSKISSQECYSLLVGAIIPRPIAWISTQSDDGIINLAPFSFFTVASVAPPVLAISQVNPKNGREKDTLRNLRATKQCVVNIVSYDNRQIMNACSAEYPPEIGEMEKLGIPAAASNTVAPPGVANAKVRFECTLQDVITLAETPAGGKLILLNVQSIFVDETILTGGKIDSVLLDAIAKMGGDQYSTTRDKFEMVRPTLTT